MSIVSVNCENLQANPRCAHGPTLKFCRLIKGKIRTFYACSACRNRKDCPFYLLEDEIITDSKQLVLEEWKKNILPLIEPDHIFKRLHNFKKITSKKNFCLSCFDYVFPDEFSNHKNHSLRVVNNKELNSPTKILYPLTNDKSHAQYWFSEKTVHFIIDNLIKMKFTNVLCIGTPTLHEVLYNKNVKSLLLDIDHRYHWFYSPSEYLWFNMFNFYFLNDNDSCRKELNNFLNNSTATVVIDPPFGARIEPLQNTICELQKLGAIQLNIMLVLPYFMEPQVLKSFPDFNMLDFPVEYINHKKFKDKKNDNHGKGSPVRIFTNINPKMFEFPKNDGYHYCKICEAWRSKLNVHCYSCNLCPSKNGDSYRHCNKCNKCVKQTWKHCMSCNKCILPDHICKSSGKVERNNCKKKKK